jgi:hypothetical protein
MNEYGSVEVPEPQVTNEANESMSRWLNESIQ